MSISQKYLDEIKLAFKTEEEFEAFLNSCQKPLKKSIKISLHKILPEEFIEETKEEGWHLTSSGFILSSEEIKEVRRDKIEQNNEKDFLQDSSDLSSDFFLPEDIFYVDRDNTDIPLGKTFYHQSGFFYIQEIAAGLAARQLFDENTSGSEIILDMSAAPGGKSVQIGDYLMYLAKKNNKKLGTVVSNDLSKSRLIALGFNLNRMGIYNSYVTNFNGFSFGKNLPNFFDKILLDAPCSGEGTGFKSDFGLKYWRKEEINKIAGTQYLLLVSALKSVKVGGTIVFSTCTMNPYENEYNLKRLLEEYKGVVELEDVKLIDKSYGFTQWKEEFLLSEKEAKKVARFWPHIQKTGGFFISKLRKVADLPVKVYENKLLKTHKQAKLDLSSKLQKEVRKILKDNYGIIPDDDILFVASSNFIYAVNQDFEYLLKNLAWEKFGTPIFKKSNRGQFRPNHFLGILFGDKAENNVVYLSKQQAYDYALGKDLNLLDVEYKIDNPFMDYVILKYKKWGIGVAKLIQKDGVLKNKYIKN